jgi:hypothetical protein
MHVCPEQYGSTTGLELVVACMDYLACRVFLQTSLNWGKSE